MEKQKTDHPLKTISFSSLMNWKNCKWLFKLAAIDKLPMFSDSIDTFFGTLLHEAVQDVLGDKKSTDLAYKRFNRAWRLFHFIETKFNLTDEIYDQYDAAAKQIIENIYPVFEKKFGKFTVLGIETQLLRKVSDRFPQDFKGFIDIVIQYGENSIAVIDFKTCLSVFMFKKYQDKYKESQLVYYKNFIAKELEVNPDDIECFFVLCEKTAKTKGLPIEVVRVTSGPKKTQNAIDFLEGALESINANIFIKDKTSCQRGSLTCPFKDTVHCKTPKYFK